MTDKPTFEQAVNLLANKPTPTFLALNADVFYNGMLDLAARVANLEHASLESTFRTTALEGVSNDTVTKLGAIEGEHTAYKKRVEAVEQAPAVNAKKIDDLNTRVRTVEGAVGSANIKKAGPIEPIKTVAPTPPIIPSAPGPASAPIRP